MMLMDLCQDVSYVEFVRNVMCACVVNYILGIYCVLSLIII